MIYLAHVKISQKMNSCDYYIVILRLTCLTWFTCYYIIMMDLSNVTVNSMVSLCGESVDGEKKIWKQNS